MKPSKIYEIVNQVSSDTYPEIVEEVFTILQRDESLLKAIIAKSVVEISSDVFNVKIELNKWFN